MGPREAGGACFGAVSRSALRMRARIRSRPEFSACSTLFLPKRAKRFGGKFGRRVDFGPRTHRISRSSC